MPEAELWPPYTHAGTSVPMIKHTPHMLHMCMTHIHTHVHTCIHICMYTLYFKNRRQTETPREEEGGQSLTVKGYNFNLECFILRF